VCANVRPMRRALSPYFVERCRTRASPALGRGWPSPGAIDTTLRARRRVRSRIRADRLTAELVDVASQDQISAQRRRPSELKDVVAPRDRLFWPPGRSDQVVMESTTFGYGVSGAELPERSFRLSELSVRPRMTSGWWRRVGQEGGPDGAASERHRSVRSLHCRSNAANERVKRHGNVYGMSCAGTRELPDRAAEARRQRDASASWPSRPGG